MSSWDALGIPNPILNETWLPDLRRCLYKNHGIKHANVTNSTKLICSRSLFSAKNWRGRRAKARAKALVRLHDNLTTFWGGCHWCRPAGWKLWVLPSTTLELIGNGVPPKTRIVDMLCRFTYSYTHLQVRHAEPKSVAPQFFPNASIGFCDPILCWPTDVWCSQVTVLGKRHDLPSTSFVKIMYVDSSGKSPEDA